MTSHDVVAIVRRVLGQRSVGHVGTLDPFATGLLILLVGRATRLARFITGFEKRYRAEAILGVRTDTDDRTGSIISQVDAPQWPSRERIVEVMAEFVGPLQQRPPRFSAKHIGGRRAYALARAGEPVDLKSTSVEVHRISVVEWQPPRLTFEATVSTGTYIRSLARDLGERLGLGAHLAELRREQIGPHRVEDAVSMDDLGPEMQLLEPGALIPHLRRVEVNAAEAEDVRHGRAVSRDDAAGAAVMMAQGRFLGVAEGADGVWRPRVVLESA